MVFEEIHTKQNLNLPKKELKSQDPKGDRDESERVTKEKFSTPILVGSANNRAEEQKLKDHCPLCVVNSQGSYLRTATPTAGHCASSSGIECPPNSLGRMSVERVQRAMTVEKEC
ncbi:hypothetical protein CEXT_213291 [Caerostris extrusa]|uniref:Uncharacterized protein n=1 Tax=Caerostris extrusa TaxID=172846 RepID=A0AAV4Q7K4_CAEEX|nr:hypothetical protein CEXT_213291 [Caerostris extrusa]